MLAHGVVGSVKDCAAESDDAVGFELGGGNCGDLKAEFFLFADDENVEDVVVVHYV